MQTLPYQIIKEYKVRDYTFNENIIEILHGYYPAFSQQRLDEIHSVLSGLHIDKPEFSITTLYDISSIKFYQDTNRSKGSGTNYIIFEVTIKTEKFDYDKIFLQLRELKKRISDVTIVWSNGV